LSKLFLLLSILGRPYAGPGDSVVLTLTLAHPVTRYILVPAPLKYNKAFAWSFTLDDGLASAYLVAFPFLSGGQVSPSYIDRWGKDQGGDGRWYPGLYYTDGCGNRIPFTAALAINGHSIVDSVTGRDGNLSWQQLRTMVAAGWDVFNHGYTHATGRGVHATYEVYANDTAVERHLGYHVTQFVIPGGKDDSISREPYVEAARREGLQAVHCGCFPQDGRLDGASFLTGRQFVRSADFDTRAVFSDLTARLASGQQAWINVFTHAVGNDDLWGISLRFPDLKALFDTLETRYGAGGQDNAWVASYQEVQEYRMLLRRLGYTIRISGSCVLLTCARPPAGLRHKAMTFLWTAPSPVVGVACQGCAVESFSKRGGTQVINVIL